MTKKSSAIITLVILTLVVGGLAWKHFSSNKSQGASQPTETINYNPPTNEEKKAGDNVDIKKNTPPTTSQPPSQTSTNEVSGSASVAITDANVYNGQVEVRAFVSNMIADGTCTYTFTSSTKTITKTSPAKADVSTTNCLTLDFNVSELSGYKKWVVTVKYENQQKTASGSTQTELNI
jgi:outer membrane lipoprotein-sorting protein